MSKAFDGEGNEIEVFTADEHKAALDVEVGKVKGEYEPKVQNLTKELGSAKEALTARAGEFAQFRKLSDDQVKELTEKDRIIYENGLALQQERDKNVKAETDRIALNVESAIKAKVGDDEKLAGKVKDMYALIGIEAKTPEEIEKKVLATLGALGQTEPDLVASVAGFSSGSYAPPVTKKEGEPSFADSEAGKRGADELGLKFPEAAK